MTITTIPDWQSLTPADLHAYASAEVAQDTGTLVTVGMITELFGGEAAALVVGTIDAASATNPLLRPALMALATTGMSLGGELRQTMIDDLADAGSWPPELRNGIKALGVTRQPWWTQQTGEPVPSESDLGDLQAAAIAAAAARSALDAVASRATGAHAAAAAAFDRGETASQITDAANEAWEAD